MNTDYVAVALSIIALVFMIFYTLAHLGLAHAQNVQPAATIGAYQKTLNPQPGAPSPQNGVYGKLQ